LTGTRHSTPTHASVPKKMSVYYNEIDPYAAQWLRNLIVFGYIADGEVDERSIVDVRPEELRGFTQCHFFAGIGVWSYALKRAGWSDDRPVWTGSCPCQPFSAAGKRGGTADERHLWPAWFHLIQHSKPRGVPVFGEQVASKDGLAWLDLVHADLEGQGYTVRSADLCAAGVGAPHIRQRLYFVADASSARAGRDAGAAPGAEARGNRAGSADGSGGDAPVVDRATGVVADAERDATESRGLAVEPAEGARAPRARPSTESGRRSVPGVMADADGRDASAEGIQRGREHGLVAQDGRPDRRVGDAGYERLPLRERETLEGARRREEGRAVAEPGRSFWTDCDWLPCIDGKARPVEPGTFPLAHGAPARVGRLRAYGNAIVAPLAEEFIRAYLSDE
jgi:DNA (cytosine-5)-methyltransferase 1